jgi:copper homeostasis protein (lipoprotein)
MKLKFIALAVVSLALSACAQKPESNTAAFAAEHNARVALDWAGTYRGELPCADCEAIKTTVTLDSNGTYQSKAEYVGRSGSPLVEKGKFTWNAAGNTITLGQGEPQQYFVSENRLIRLAMDGSRITGPIADKYVLQKDTASK